MDVNKKLSADLSPLGAWSFAVGAGVGWGSLVVTSSSYLAQAGPLGSVLGLAIGTVIMLVIARNYAYLMRLFPESGGAYAYTREAFGYDHGFLVAWFLALTYLSVLWANATSLPLFVRYFVGDVLRFGRLYAIFGYDVYVGEALLTVIALVLVGFLCMRSKRAAAVTMKILVIVLAVGIVIVTAAAFLRRGQSMAPAIVPDTSALSQIVKIAVISPWAFIGFESISHATAEFSFDRSRVRRILILSVLALAVLYILVILLSVTAYPERYDSWFAYIQDLGNLEGIEALPPFYAAGQAMGSAGIGILMVVLLALVATSLIANVTVLSRLFYALAKDRILPMRFGSLNERELPGQAVGLVLAVSVLIPLLGRTAIGWIVDVTTICATLIYAFVSVSAIRLSDIRGDTNQRVYGIAGLVLMLFFGVYLLLPSLVADSSLARETFFLFIVWSVLGFVFFRTILRRDKERRFGSSIIVWVALLALVLLIALIWMRQSMIASNNEMLAHIESYYASGAADGQRRADELFIAEQMSELQASDSRTILMATGMFAFAIAIMLSNHAYLNKRSRESEAFVSTDPLTGVKSKHAYVMKEKVFDADIASGACRDFALVVCDVNELKYVNDNFGHKAGDEYICAACRLICEIFQHSPVYRTGGDEFVALLTGRDYESREELMQALRFRSEDHVARKLVVVSAGMAEYIPGSDTGLHDVFGRADGLMYQEKKRLKSLGASLREERGYESPHDKRGSMREIFEADKALSIRRHVLIVEDEEINRMLLGVVLEGSFELLYAADGEEALEIMRENSERLALVLLDLLMPRMDGREVLSAMRDDPTLVTIPVIVLTADQNAEVECLEIGAMDFLPKPYPPKEVILARVHKCIELAENRDTLRFAERDTLTGLYNLDFFRRYVGMYDTHYPDEPMDAVVVDVNHFHMINERYGRVYGDDVLRRIGERVKGIVLEADGIGCRRGSDVFLIYCPHREDYESLLETASQGLGGDEAGEHRVRLRMGVYANADKTLDFDRRFDRAKMAADSVKSGFMKPVAQYDDALHESALYKEQLLEDFRPSIEQHRFKVYFQPKFDIRPDEPILTSAEALVRWDHPTMGLVSPGIFIPLLEDNGLILELDRYVWEETARQIRQWKDTHGFAVPVSVNVSRIDMLMPDLKGIFREILDTYNLTTDDIVLEITESAYTGDSDQVISTARELRGMGMGFRIEMDDFGTGYSSLGMLSHLPIDALKLDMTFVRNAFGETRDVRMIELIIDIADYLQVPVVAEGVETEEQLLTLKAMGCDIVQGYYFSRPVPSEEFDRFLVERGNRSVEVTSQMRKTYLSMSAALNGGFEYIYFIDTLTDYYLCFRTDPGGDLSIRTGTASFFLEARSELLASVAPEDKERMAEVLSREWLIEHAPEGSVTVPFRRRGEDGSQPCILQTIRGRAGADHHIVFGIRPASAPNDTDPTEPAE